MAIAVDRERPNGAGIRLAVSTDRDIVAARAAGRDLARAAGFGITDQTRFATAISELARNVVRHASDGSCALLRDRLDAATIRIRAVVEDNGPGIPDIALAMEDGYSTARGLGAGLPGTRRLMHEFAIESRPGHTKVSIGLTRRIG